jgi:hypothetical protein
MLRGLFLNPDFHNKSGQRGFESGRTLAIPDAVGYAGARISTLKAVRGRNSASK